MPLKHPCFLQHQRRNFTISCDGLPNMLLATFMSLQHDFCKVVHRKQRLPWKPGNQFNHMEGISGKRGLWLVLLLFMVVLFHIVKSISLRTKALHCNYSLSPASPLLLLCCWSVFVKFDLIWSKEVLEEYCWVTDVYMLLFSENQQISFSLELSSPSHVEHVSYLLGHDSWQIIVLQRLLQCTLVRSIYRKWNQRSANVLRCLQPTFEEKWIFWLSLFCHRKVRNCKILWY